MAKGLLSACAALSMGCASCGGLDQSPDPNHCLSTYCVGGEKTTYTLAYGGPMPVDVLIAVDGSVPSGPQAPVMERALRAMVERLPDLAEIWLHKMDLNLALVSASLATNATIDGASGGLWPATPLCPQPNGPYLHDARSCDSPSNYQGTLGDALACAALHMPVTGQPGRPLETLRALLAPGGLAETGGFRRKDAPLYLVVITREDDPAAASDALRTEYADALGANAPDWVTMVAVIAPASAQGLLAFAGLADGAFDDLAATSWTGPAWIAEPHIAVDWEVPCVDGQIVDAAPEAPGIHPDCFVEERDRSATVLVERPIPFCQGAGADPDPCWKTRPSHGRCPAPGLEFQIVRSEFACMPDYSINYLYTCATNLQ